jgi:hypothetical protein
LLLEYLDPSSGKVGILAVVGTVNPVIHPHPISDDCQYPVVEKPVRRVDRIYIKKASAKEGGVAAICLSWYT